MRQPLAIKLIAACAITVSATVSFAQDVIRIANIVELSGAGATAGTNFKNGVELAVKEINTMGGILGKKIQTVTTDTQSNPGVAKGLTQKAIDDGVFAIFGPVFSGSIMVSMAESRRAEVPNFTGGE
ncbi:ABC transporter substrate-binding protein, partial [Polaromonas sp.]|uniref:ABC transporter substrate-binding protein n=1 Tax=Polaromonas sp. TaxID=1869339 RepID=UPI002FC8BAD4